MKKKYLIRNGKIADGTGREHFAGSILLENGRIAAIRRQGEAFSAEEERGAVAIDAAGAWITPGFIDIHRHGDWQALTGGDDELLNRQGITTVVNGNCGLSAAPQGGAHEAETEHFLRSFIGAKPGLGQDGGEMADPARSMADYLDALRSVRRSVHTGILAGGGTLRAGVAGYAGGPLSGQQEEEIRQRVRQSLEAGALGISLGLGYSPELAYDEEGLVRVLEPIRGTGVPVAVHIRTEGDGSDRAVAEMIRVCAALNAPLHLSHMKCIGKRNWRVTCAKELEMIRAARRNGMDVTMDTYPYVTGATQLVHLIPPQFQAGGTRVLLEYLAESGMRRQITQELRKPSDAYENDVELVGFENIYATGLRSEKFRSMDGLTIAKIAEETGSDPYETLYDILLEERCEPTMLDTYGCEEDLEDFLKDPLCSVISDAIYPEGGRRHPRVYDSFPRFLIRYVRDRQVFSMEEAVRKMTSLPAEVYGLDRGILREGMSADLCVFRLENLQSHADFSDPENLCTGFDYVFTAGEPCVEKDRWTNTGSGQALCKPYKFS